MQSSSDDGEQMARPSWCVCDVTAFGARGDNRTKDTAALRAAIAACKGGGEILLPAPGRYLTGPINITSHQVLRVEQGAMMLASLDMADYPMVASFPSYPGSRDLGPSVTCRFGALVGAVGADNVTVTGGGVIDGQGWDFWARFRAKNRTALPCSRPHLLEFERVSDLTVSHLTLRNSPFWAVHPIYSRRLRFTDLSIHAPTRWGDLKIPNTDGIDPDSSSDVLIEDCLMDVGDDGVAIKSGMNEAGVAFGVPSTNITIRNITTRTLGGIAIGSELSGGVRDVHVQNVRLLGTRGIHIKTAKGRGGYVENISFEDVVADVDMWTDYSDGNASGPYTTIRNISFRNVAGKCKVGCDTIPSPECDAAEFHFEEACGH